MARILENTTSTSLQKNNSIRDIVAHSKELKEFQALLIEIEQLNLVISFRKETAEFIRIRYFTEMSALFESYKSSVELYIEAFHQQASLFELSKHEFNSVGQVLTQYIEQVFSGNELNPEIKKIHSFWFNSNHSGKIRLDTAAKSFSDKLLSNDNEIETEIEHSNFYDEQESYFKSDHQFKRKKSKREKESDELKNSISKATSKSLKNMYKSLIRALHPDTELDMAIQLEKTEVVKRITNAYQNKDLKSLIEIELEWIHKETAHIEQLAKEELQIYILAFKDQIEALKNELKSISTSEKFASFASIIGKDKVESESLLKKEKANWKAYIDYLSQRTFFFNQNKDKRLFLDLIYNELE